MAPRSKQQSLVSEQLRQAIVDSGLSAYALGQLAGVSRSVVSAFLDRRRGLTTETVDRIAPHVGLRVSWPQRRA